MSVALADGTELAGGRYVLRRKLGTGGAASVWLADDTVLERPVAVKVLSEAFAADESWMARFEREARIAAALTHPNLVSVYDFGSDTDRPYIVMEYMPGGSLYQHIATGEDVDVESLAHDLLSALEAIHAEGIVHRDVKPGNVLLSASGTACLTDFGVARPEDAESLTQTGHIPGTGEFMAPELWTGQPADERSDLYAAGIVLQRASEAGVPPELDHLIESLTAEDRSERPASAGAALAMLGGGDLVSAAPTVLDPPVERGAAEEPAPRPVVIKPGERSGRRLAIAGIAILGIVAVIALALAIGEGDDPATSGPGKQASADPRPDGGSERKKPEGQETATAGGGESSQGDPSVDAIALDQEGKALIDAGDPQAAIPILRRAVNSYPEGTRDINYAYSLYNLAHALHLSGKSKQAIPLLEERLTFDDQTETVQALLDDARAAADD